MESFLSYRSDHETLLSKLMDDYEKRTSTHTEYSHSLLIMIITCFKTIISQWLSYLPFAKRGKDNLSAFVGHIFANDLQFMAAKCFT